MATDYVDAGQAIDNSSLSGIVGSAPPVTDGVTYERILNARSEPQNWLTYYGAYDWQRYSPLDQITKENVKQLTPAWVFQCGSVGLHSGKSTYSFEASPLVVNGLAAMCWRQAMMFMFGRRGTANSSHRGAVSGRSWRRIRRTIICWLSDGLFMCVLSVNRNQCCANLCVAITRRIAAREGLL